MEIIPRQESRNLINPNSVFLVSLFLFVSLIITFFVFHFMEVGVRNDIQKLEKDFLVLGQTEREQKLEQEVLSAEKKIRDFESLTALRKNALLFFKFLETYVHSSISFENITLTNPTNTVLLEGRTSDFLTIEDQIALFAQRPEVQSVKLLDLKIGEKGGILFTVEVIFSPLLFKP